MRALFLVVLSIVGAVLAALLHAVSVGPDAGLKTLALPGVRGVATVAGVLAGLAISPIMVWALRGRDLKFTLPCVYAISLATVLVSNLAHMRRSVYFSFGVTVLTLCAVGIRRKESRTNGSGKGIGS